MEINPHEYIAPRPEHWSYQEELAREERRRERVLRALEKSSEIVELALASGIAARAVALRLLALRAARRAGTGR